MEEYYDGVITKPPLDEDTLMHYGVKGMRWGHRKSPEQRVQYLKRKRDRALKRASYTQELDNKYAENSVNRRIRRNERKNKKLLAKGYTQEHIDTKKGGNRRKALIKEAKDQQQYTHEANRKYSQIINDNYSAKIKAVNNPEFKKSKTYKNATNRYKRQKVSDFVNSATSIYLTGGAVTGGQITRLQYVRQEKYKKKNKGLT